jgi:hypothetical protein
MRIIKVSVLFFALVLVQCKSSQVAFYPTSELSLISSEGDLLKLGVLGYGVSQQDAVIDAKINAFNNLFFRGIPNSSNQNPLISIDEKKILAKHNAYFQELYQGMRMNTFINEYILIASDKTNVLAQKLKNRKVKQESMESVAAYIEISINTRALKKDLENYNIIKAFGF